MPVLWELEVPEEEVSWISVPSLVQDGAEPKWYLAPRLCFRLRAVRTKIIEALKGKNNAELIELMKLAVGGRQTAATAVRGP